jgi:hypothetical protein
MMKNYRLLWGASAMVIAGAAFFAPGFLDQKQKYVPRNGEARNEKSMKGAAEYIFNMRKNQVTGMIDEADVINARMQAEAFNLAKLSSTAAVPSMVWEELGPDNVGGRTRALLIDKNNSNRMYAGGVAGGLWISIDGGSSWSKYSDALSNMCVTSICQAADGDIYFGTGEGLYSNFGFGAGGFPGGGIWKSEDGGNTFNLLPGTSPTNINNQSVDWLHVNRLAAHPTDPNKILAATNRGIRMTTDGGATWSNPVTLNPSSATAVISAGHDIDIAKDGSLYVASLNGKVYISTTGEYQTWTSVSTGGNSLPISSASRIDIDISPDNSNYIYASAAKTGLARLLNIYLSTDKGATWTIIGPGGTLTFDPFGANGQGDYDNVIAVVPGSNSLQAIVGGVQLWKWEATSASSPTVGQWTRIAVESPDIPQNPFYVHADKHAVVFKPGQPSIFYVATDGGVFKTIDGGQLWIPCNKNYNVTQFYSVAFKSHGVDPFGNTGSIVMGGTQDNGTQYIDGNGNSVYSSFEVTGGDGGYVAMSTLNPSAIFSTIYYGQAFRSANDGSSMAEFYNSRINAIPNLGNDWSAANFVTPIDLWESASEFNFPDSVLYVASTNIAAGTTFTVPSKTNSLPISYTTPVALAPGDSIMVQDHYQSKFVVGFSGSVYMTREALNFAATPDWMKIAGTNSKPNAYGGTTNTFAWSADGDILYVGNTNGGVYRLSGISQVTDSLNNGDVDSLTTANLDAKVRCTLIGNFGSGRVITGLAVDPNDAGRLVVTLGNYGNTTYVYYTNNADAAPTANNTSNFTAKQGTGLPQMPVYSVTFDKWSPNRVVIGTEMGVYACDNITVVPAWDHTSAAQNMPTTPVFMVRQQQKEPWQSNNAGVIYAATHGRGFWKTNTTFVPVSINDHNHSNSSIATSVIVSPNPVTEKAMVGFTLKEGGNLVLKVYNLNGQLVKTIRRDAQAGVMQIEISSEDLRAGTYLVSIECGKQTGTTKFVVVK